MWENIFTLNKKLIENISTLKKKLTKLTFILRDDGSKLEEHLKKLKRLKNLLTDETFSKSCEGLQRDKIPGDKSISHRALICASISDGTSKISNLQVKM